MTSAPSGFQRRGDAAGDGKRAMAVGEEESVCIMSGENSLWRALAQRFCSRGVYDRPAAGWLD
ncbi:MAG: hypothetical protein Tsb0032_13020 [Kiloniellaceae bacterium]